MHASSQHTRFTYARGLCVVVQPKLDEMHYIDYPFADRGGTCNANVLNTKVNVLLALRAHNQTIADPNADPWARGVALRYLLHMVGDLHQPLHTVTRCTPDSPNGDSGGNGFRLLTGSSAGDVRNLHSMWDSMGGAYIDTIEDVRASDGSVSFGCSSPSACGEIEAIRLEMVEAEAKALVAEHGEEVAAAAAGELWYTNAPNPPVSADGSSVTTDGGDAFEQWSKESYRLARGLVYTGLNVTEGETPSEEYVEAVQAEAKRRIVIGGVRLGSVLDAAVAEATVAAATAEAACATAGAGGEEGASVWLGVIAGVAVGLAAGGGAGWCRRGRRDPRRPKLRIYSAVGRRESDSD